MPADALGLTAVHVDRVPREMGSVTFNGGDTFDDFEGLGSVAASTVTVRILTVPF